MRILKVLRGVTTLEEIERVTNITVLAPEDDSEPAEKPAEEPELKAKITQTPLQQ